MSTPPEPMEAPPVITPPPVIRPPAGQPPAPFLPRAWRVVRVAIFGAVCLITLCFLFNAEENWRAKRNWARCRQELLSRGEKLDVKDFIPAPVPDEQNFAATPLLAKTLGEKEPNNPLSYRLEGSRNEPSLGNWRAGKATDMQAWSDYFGPSTNTAATARSNSPAQQVLAALGRQSAEMEELRAASQRRYSQFRRHWSGDAMAVLLPHLGVSKGLAQTMTLHAIAALSANQSDEALADLKVNWRIVEALGSHPILITYLVAVAINELSLQGVWEGLAAHRWNERQLTELDQLLARQDLVSSAAATLRGERAFMNAVFDQMLLSPTNAQSLFEAADNEPALGQKTSRLTRILFPGWIIHRSQAQMNQFMQSMVDSLEKARQQPETHPIIDPSVTNLWNQRLGKSSPYNALARGLLQAVGSTPDKVAKGQASLNLARTGIALERYRLAHNSLPETLAQLVPNYLPKVPLDPYTGKKLKYHRLDDARFTLYSVGANGADDGAQLVRKRKGGIDLEKGDVLWTYLPPSAEKEGESSGR